MSAAPRALLNILWLLRAMKAQQSGQNPTGFIQALSGNDHSEVIILRLLAYIEEQCDAAVAFIQSSTLTDEEQAGVLETLGGLKQAFSIQGMQQSYVNFVPQIGAAISQISFLLPRELRESARPPEVNELIQSIEEVMQELAGADLDGRVREVARKHLHILATLLRNVEILGVDTALAAYFELCARIQRELRTAPTGTREKVKKVWPEIERWFGRIAMIEKALESGGTLLHKAQGAFQLLLSHLG